MQWPTSPYFILSLKEWHLDWGVPNNQISTGMHSLQPDVSIVENHFHSRLQAVRQPSWSRGWAAGYLKTWDIFGLISSLCISLLQSCNPWGRGSVCVQRASTSWTTLLKESGLSRARNSTWQCWGTPNTGPAPVCRDSLGRTGRCFSSIHTGVDTTHVGLCSTSLKH